ncbi:MAG: 16S rRNA (guanine(966)-N(2))-methyltransferase RsmD [Alphaproteobacteria bacterium]
MRVVAGRLRGRRLLAPEGRDVRPTSDRARQAVFNIIEHGGLAASPLDGANVIDAFAGTGALGIEALSRGATHCTFVEKERAALAALERNLDALGLKGAARIMRSDVPSLPPATAQAAFAFLDPPYGENLAASALDALARRGWLAQGALCIVELGARDDFAPPPGFTPLDDRRYGAARIAFLRYDGRE